MVFRGAQMAGLFPVSGLKKGGSRSIKNNITNNNKDTIEFRPASFRLIATVVFVLAVVVLEGLGLLHMLLNRRRPPLEVENGNAIGGSDLEAEDGEGEGVQQSDYKHGSGINSNLAPVVHYGTTVRGFVRFGMNFPMFF